MSGPGRINELGDPARALGSRALLVTEEPLIKAGHAAALGRVLCSAGIGVETFAEGSPNPDSALAEKLRAFAAPRAPGLIVGLGGGSAMDLAKAANFLLTNGGSMSDYAGYGNAARDLLPMILVPTTTGTGSEAQSYCVISESGTGRKMACGAPSAAAKLAVLDPELAVTQPRAVRAASGFDAIAHVVETWVTTKRNDLSSMLAREAWRLLSGNFERCLARLEDVGTIADMQWGACLAGWAIEQSMLGAAHACANPLTQTYGTTHAHALAVMLPHVVRFNMELMEERYRELDANLPARLDSAIAAADLPRTLRELGAREQDLESLARCAADQWTGHHNPRPFDEHSALELYRCAW